MRPTQEGGSTPNPIVSFGHARHRRQFEPPCAAYYISTLNLDIVNLKGGKYN